MESLPMLSIEKRQQKRPPDCAAGDLFMPVWRKNVPKQTWFGRKNVQNRPWALQ